MARSLLDVVRKPAKADGSPNWIQQMFGMDLELSEGQWKSVPKAERVDRMGYDT
jgi:hypothetical protein